MNLLKPLAFALGLVVLAYGAMQLNRFSYRSADEPSAQGFSVDRALGTIKLLSQKPHPMGSTESVRIRNALVQKLTALGLEVQIQTDEVVDGNTLATVSNVVARLPGKGPGKALLLMAHYDSVDNSFGANDAGYGVATLLETARVIKQGEPLANDLILLFSDGEEKGLFGAKAFVENNPLAKQVGMVVNFEARGSKGPMMLFETGMGNDGLIGEFAASAAKPVGDSLWLSIYRMMPNMTDVDAFDKNGLSVLNFGYLDGKYHYHSARDAFDNVSRETLAQAGDNALNLVRHFGNVTLPVAGSGDAVFFNLFGSLFIHYSAWVGYGLLVLALGLFVWLYRMNCAANEGQPARLVVGTLVVWLQYLLAGLMATVLLSALQNLFMPDYFSRQAAEGQMFIGVVVLALAINLGWTRLPVTAKPWKVAVGALVLSLVVAVATGFDPVAAAIVSLLIGGGLFAVLKLYRQSTFEPLYHLSAWLVPGALLSVLAPEMAHIFVLPVLALAGIEALGRRFGKSTLWLSAAAAALGFLMWSYYIEQMVLALGDSAPGVIVLFSSMVAGLLWPLLKVHGEQAKGYGVAAYALIAALFWLTPALMNPFSADKPQPDELHYWADLDNHKAFWVSSDRSVARWARPLLGQKDSERRKNELGIGRRGKQWQSPAEVVAIEPASLVQSSSQAIEGGRALSLKLTPGFAAEQSYLLLSTPEQVRGVSVNGHALSTKKVRDGQMVIRLLAVPAKGVDIELQLSGDKPLTIKLVETQNAMPQALEEQLPKRPADHMPRPYSLSDSTVVSQTVAL